MPIEGAKDPLMNTVKLARTAAAIAAASLTANAITIDFGTSWPAFTAPGLDTYASSPFNLVLAKEDGQHSTESDIATLLNSVVGGSFLAADIHKTDQPPEIGGSDGYFTVPSGWEYLVAQYDGPHGGSVVIQLDGNDAKLPFASSLIWGTGDQYAVSHFSVAGLHPESITTPEGGATVMLLGIGLIGIAALRRKLK